MGPALGFPLLRQHAPCPDCHQGSPILAWPRPSWIDGPSRAWGRSQQRSGRPMAMAGPGQEPFGPSCGGPASPMGPKAPLSHGSLSPWGCPRGLGVLNCDLARQEPALLQIFFRIGPVWGFGCVSSEFPVGLDGPDRVCRGGSGHSGFHLKSHGDQPMISWGIGVNVVEIFR